MTFKIDCVFCKIIAGQIPSVKIAEDALTLAFMDINPLSKGHCLIVPKPHFEKVHELPNKLMEAVGRMIVKVSKAMNVENYNILQNNGPEAGQVVPHVHFHIIPSTNPENSFVESAKNWKPFPMTHEELEQEALLIKSRMWMEDTIDTTE
mmetsp:Transcript_15449/g.24161  ORF Transcript_15449/g.24161 Transcript_15449/m.24161 type:complete len:150 (-) Transcript_15449:22-471(-)|eukprot:CAMPEP_0201524292 /NCGR_PEP_ID=MMETSP0161_2-20130828/21229_1 /ASSEMBLY_ACC=CAM_ASM_000251 /TAXON_ID=180227 /ORGANISM="Neoparamoeba aestuarina, Strain SoJaBio B1-5/56/2" /LENGTH=149 /DNA_ID=CAMNT_0047923609 /DNA_START=33 /DNA_END=482 /DNA_ORIENTATION=+